MNLEITHRDDEIVVQTDNGVNRYYFTQKARTDTGIVLSPSRHRPGHIPPRIVSALCKEGYYVGSEMGYAFRGP